MTRHLPLSQAGARRGSVLIVVLWASIGLVSIALLFGHSMMMNYRGSDNFLAGQQADQAIEGAIRYAQTLVSNEDTPGVLPDLTSYQGEAMQVGEGEFWLLGRGDGDTNRTTREYGLVDEASKLNLNATPLPILKELFALIPGITDDVISAIDEWRTPASGGVANDGIKHGDFESVEELALVAGMTRELLYGEDANQNGVLDGNEDDGERSLPKDNADGKLDPGLLEFVTVFTKEPKTQPGGTTPRLDVAVLGTPQGGPALTALLDEVLPGHAAVNIRPAAYASVIDFLATSGVSPALSEEDLDKIAPYLTSEDPAKPGEPLVRGLVNINTASETVLSAIVGTAIAADLVAQRLSRGTSPSTGIAWAVQALQPVQPPGNLRYLTGQSYQVSADVAAVGRHGRGYRRERVVIDTSDSEKGPQIIYRRNLAPLGWALGHEARENLALKKEVR